MTSSTPGYSADSTLADVLASPGGRAVVERHLAGIVNSPLRIQLLHVPLGQLFFFDPLLRTDPAARQGVLDELAAMPAATAPARVEQLPGPPSPDYEDASVAAGSVPFTYPESSTRWGMFEVRIDGPAHGNPFTEVALDAELTGGGRTRQVPGFYDGDGVYRLRFSPDTEGPWTFRTTSNARSLDGLAGSFTCVPAAPGRHGPVRVADTFHFRYADGTRFLPLGTTAYAWTHQGDALEEQTLATLAASDFTKIRMCVFPKSYLYNANEPERYPFESRPDGSPESRWDTTRFVPDFFAHLEQRIAQLADLGIEADLILFHPYDRWGFSDLGPAADDRYVRYVVARLAAFSNVWWSLANEYDLVRAKTTDDWERFAGLVTEADPYGHLLSIHNCLAHYDHRRPWVTHASVQRIDMYRTAENVTEWREEWGKPVVVDECAYEGDIDQGWGNITAEELLRRCWEGAIRGGYVTHGETFLDPDDVLWWAKGGVLKGESPSRIGFLRQVLAAGPEHGLEPLPSDWDVPSAGVAGEYVLSYFGFLRPRFRTFVLAPGTRYSVTIIDTWNMTQRTLPGYQEGVFRVDLPGWQYLAVLLRAQRSGQVPT